MKYDIDLLSKKIENRKTVKKIVKFIILFILIISFSINIFLAIEDKYHIFGIHIFNIISESMKPNLEVNDVIIVKKIEPSILKENDIITFENDGRIISHRIMNIYNENNSYKFTTKGDNNNFVDLEIISEKDVYGKVIFKISKIGKIVEYMQNKRGLLNIAILIIIIFIIISLNDNKKSARKITRKKYEIKKIRDNYNLD